VNSVEFQLMKVYAATVVMFFLLPCLICDHEAFICVVFL